jgi:hypothetical protein
MLIARVVKSRMIRCMGQVVHMGEISAYKILGIKLTDRNGVGGIGIDRKTALTFILEK